MIRTALVRAKPWQRYVICVLMIAAGGALVVLGHVAGVLLAASGVLLLWRMVAYRLRRGRRSRNASAEHDPR